jgi:hypothetical protein
VAQPANGTPEDFLRRKRESVARGNTMGIALSDLNMQVQATSSGTWPTPNAQDGERGPESAATKAARGAGGVNLREAAGWPTPRAEDAEQTGGHGEAMDTLTSHARFVDTASTTSRSASTDAPTAKGTGWNTPSAQDAKNLTLPPSQTNRDSVVGQLLRESPSTAGKPHGSSGSLNAAWVQQLMGYPDGWLDLPTSTLSTLSATRRSRRSSKS